jgi:hypothetical protein
VKHTLGIISSMNNAASSLAADASADSPEGIKSPGELVLPSGAFLCLNRLDISMFALLVTVGP